MKDTLSDVNLFDIFQVGKVYYFCGLPLVFRSDGKFERQRGRGRPKGSSNYNSRLVQIRVPLSIVPEVSKLKQEARIKSEKERFLDSEFKTDNLVNEYLDYIEIV